MDQNDKKTKIQVKTTHYGLFIIPTAPNTTWPSGAFREMCRRSVQNILVS